MELARAVGDHVLRGEVEADATAFGFEIASKPADLAQEDEWLVGGAAVDLGLDARVGERGPTADRRASRRAEVVAPVVSSRSPQSAGRSSSGRRLGGSLAELVREHRRVSVGQVLRHAPDERLAVEALPGATNAATSAIV